jgi:hypothetical protein
MNRFGLEALLVNSSLESLIQEFVGGKTQDVIELKFLIGEKTISMHSVEEGSTFEQSSGVFFLEGEQFSGCFSEPGEEEMDSPYLSLVLKAVFADQLKLVIDSFLFEGPSGCVEGGRV